MNLSPDLLLTAAAARLRAARPDLAAGTEPLSARSLASARAEIRSGAGGVSAVAVVRTFRMASWVRETCVFAAALTPEQACAWRRSFTRTHYLAGNPDNLRERFAFTRVAGDGTVAWAGPAPDENSAALRRLLRTYHGGRSVTGWRPVTVEIPGAPGAGRPPVHRDLHVATVDLTLADVLVHVGHLLAEAVIDDLIGPGDRLTLRSVPRLTHLPVPFAALRVDTDRHRPDQLRAHAALTREI